MTYRSYRFWQWFRAHWHRMGAAHLVLVISLIPTIIAYQRVKEYARAQELQRFEQIAQSSRENIERHTLRHIEALNHIKSLIDTPGITPTDREDYLERAGFYGTYSAFLHVAQIEKLATRPDDPWPNSEDTYRIAIDKKRNDVNSLKTSFDTAQKQAFAELISLAVTTGSIEVSETTYLTHPQTGKRMGLVAIAIPLGNAASRTNDAPKGVVFATIDIARLVANLLPSAEFPNLAASILDHRETRRYELDESEAAQKSSTLERVVKFQLANRTWSIRMTPLGQFYLGPPSRLPWFVLGAGISVNLLLYGIARMQANARLEAERLTEDLRAVQERDRMLERATNDAIWDWDILRKRLVWNEAMQAMFRYSANDLDYTVDWWLERLIPTDRRRVWNGREMAVQTGGEFWADEYQFRRGDGTYASVIDRGFIIRDRQGIAIRMIGSMVDITGQKEAEEARQISERKLALHIQQTPLAVIEWDLDFEVTAWNPAAEKIFGYAASEAIGNPARELIVHAPRESSNSFLFSNMLAGDSLPAEVRDTMNNTWHDILKEASERESNKAGKNPANGLSQRSINAFAVVNRTKAGNPIICDWYNTPLVDSGGKVIGIASLVLDVTARKQAEDDLAAEKERLAVTLRSIGDGVITTDTEGRVTLINKLAEDLTGWKQGEAMGQPMVKVFNVIDQQTRTAFRNPLAQVLSSGEIVDLPNLSVLLTRDGSEKLIGASAAPIHDQDSRIIGAVLVFRDITDEQTVMEERQRAGKLDSLGILAGGIAHDFNNILTAVVGNVSFARLFAEPGDKQYGRLEEAEKAALRAKDLATQLLTFSKGGSPVRQTASLGELIQDSTSFALRGSNVRCDYAADADVWPVEVDQGQFSQVINNLVINAVQAMPDGGVLSVRASNVTLPPENNLQLPPGRYARIIVRDHGTGIAPEHLPQVFDPYFTTKEKGTGLGLATCYSIIKRHDGLITVDSTVGDGTEFHIYLPASDKVAPKRKIETDAPIEGQGRILVMDDEEIIRELAITALEFLGYEVDAVADGEACIESYSTAREQGKPYAAIIMDLTIPGGMGGVEAIKHLREIDPHVKAIVSSGYSSGPVMANYQQHGFSGMVAKPYKIEELAKALSNLIKNGKPTS